VEYLLLVELVSMLWSGERGQSANEDRTSKRSLVPSLGTDHRRRTIILLFCHALKPIRIRLLSVPRAVYSYTNAWSA